MVNEELIEKVKKYLVLLNQNGINITKAFLYGSYSRGEATDESDIDLLIVSPQYDKRDDKLIGKSWRLAAKIDSRIEPYLIGINRFTTDDVSPLLQIVKKEGLEITI